LSPSPLIPSYYQSNFLLWSSANFDGEHYLGIAKRGYETILGQSEYAFFPLFPLLVKLVTLTGVSAYAGAHLLNLVALLWFALFLVKWVAKYIKNPLTLLWLVLLSPGAVYLFALYTEPLFLALAVTTFYFAEKKDWKKAILTTAFSTATRVSGVFLVLFLFLKMRKNKWQSLFGFTGLFGYMAYLYNQTGDALAWYHAQSGWGKEKATWPWDTAYAYFRAVTLDFHPDLTHLVVVIEVALTVSMLYLLFKFWQSRLLDNSYKWYAFGSLALPLATGSLGSMPRFSLALFPLFLLIPSLPKLPRTIYYLLFTICFTIGIVLFTRGYWYA